MKACNSICEKLWCPYTCIFIIFSYDKNVHLQDNDDVIKGMKFAFERMKVCIIIMLRFHYKYEFYNKIYRPVNKCTCSTNYVI